jgi:tetratricopeptide (TPR) repeat protein
MDPLAEVLEKANALAAAGQKAEAVQCYRRFLANNPRHAEATAGLGLALAELGNLDEAIPTLRAAIALKPDFATAHQVFLSYAGLHLMLPCQPHPRCFHGRRARPATS